MEIVLALGAISLMALVVFVLYPTVMVRVRAQHDQAALQGLFANITALFHAGGARSFNSDPNDGYGALSDDPVSFASILKPLDCSGDAGYLDCKAWSASYLYVDFMSTGTCFQPDCSTGSGAPFNVFSMRVSFYNVDVATCLALINGFRDGQTSTGASAIYLIGSDYSYKPLFLNHATVADGITACQDPQGTNALMMFDFWPWGDAQHMFPGY